MYFIDKYVYVLTSLCSVFPKTGVMFTCSLLYFPLFTKTPCALLMRTIFASLARANERVHVHNERTFPQAKLDSEVNARFLLNEHGNLYFLLHNNSIHIILLKN